MQEQPTTPKRTDYRPAFKSYIDPVELAIPGVDNPRAITKIFDDAFHFYQPIDTLESIDVERIAYAQIALVRIERIESDVTSRAGRAFLRRYRTHSQQMLERAIASFKRLRADRQADARSSREIQ